MSAFARMRNLAVWYSPLSIEQAITEVNPGIAPKRLKKQEANIERSRARDSMHALESLTHLVDGEPRIISDPPLIVPINDLRPTDIEHQALACEMRGLVRSYGRTLET